jgi:hypothetical protein
MKEETTYRHLPADPCLTQEQMLGYLDGTLTPAEQHACEVHMADCDMCSDALEGLQLVKDRAVLSMPIKTGNEKEEAKVIPLGKPNKRIWYAAAASVVLILGATFIFNLLINKDESALAEKTSNVEIISNAPPAVMMDSSATASAPLGESDKLIAQDSDDEALESHSLTRSYSEAEGKEDIAYAAQEQPPVYAIEEADAVSSADVAPAVSGAVEENVGYNDADQKMNETQSKPGFIEKAKSAVSQGGLNKKTAPANAQRSELSSGTTAPSPKNEAEKKDSYSNTPSTTVVSDAPSQQQDSVSNHGPYPNKPSDRDLELSYVNGLQLFNSGQYNAALVFFEEVIKYPTHTRYQDAEFQKANTLIKLNRKEEAKVLLKSIEAKKGIHAAEATELLKGL